MQVNDLYDPYLTLKGDSQVKYDYPITFRGHDFLMAPCIFQTSKSNSKGDIEQKNHFGHFWGPKIIEPTWCTK